MRNKLFVICFFCWAVAFSQEREKVDNDVVVPTSIFTVYSLNFQPSSKLNNLNLTGYKFLIVDHFNTNVTFSTAGRINLELRNFGKDVSFEDLADNYTKAWLNKFDVTRNNDHFIWNMAHSKSSREWKKYH